MLDFFNRLYESTDFMPHGECLVWDASLLWEHAGSDVATGIAYYLIGAVLFFFIFKRRDIPFFWMFLLFGAFFLSCGTTHFMGAWTIYYPSYVIEGKIKIVNAIISLGSAVILIPLMPKLLSLPNLQNALDKVAQLNKDLNLKVLSLEEEVLKRQRAEEKLLESERKLFTLMGNLPGMAYRRSSDKSLTMEFASKGCFRLTGYQPDELVDSRAINFNDLIPSEDREYVFNTVHESLDKKLPFQLTYRLLTAAGEIKWMWEQGVGIYAANGKIMALEGFITDITKQKLAEEALSLSHDNLEKQVKERTRTLEVEIAERQQAEKKISKSYFFESTINTVLKTSLQQLSLEDLLGRVLDSILGIPMLGLAKKGSIYLVEEIPEMLVLKAHRGYDDVMLTKCSTIPFGKCLCGKAAESSTIVFANCLSECHECYREISPHGHYCLPITAGSKILGVFNLVLREGHEKDSHEEEFLSSIAATLAGIIERKKMEMEKDELQNQLIETEKLTALGRMLANVAHEIRNPLTAIGGLTKRLHNKIYRDEKEKQYTEMIISETIRLERILKSVLTFTKEPSIIRERVDLNDLVLQSLQHLQSSLDKKSLSVNREFAGAAPIMIDDDDIKEVIEHLLSNAIYVTPAGGDIFIATEQKEVKGRPYLTLKVTDTGTGIPAEEMNKIFEPFYTTKPVGPGHGIGLGLSISRKIMEEYGGHIKVESTIGRGSTFTLFFPAETF